MKKKVLVLTFILCHLTAIKIFGQANPSWDWARTAGNSNYAKSICTDAQGFIYVTGAFNNTITFGSYTLVNVSTSTNTNIYSPDVFIVKYDSLGQVLWARSGGGPGSDYGTSIQAGPNGDIFVTGYVSDSLAQFGSTQVITGSKMGQNISNLFVARYDVLGNEIWVRVSTGNSDSRATSLCVDNLENIYITGNFSGSLSYGNLSINNPTDHIFLMKLDGNGQTLWGLSAGNNLNDNASDVAVNTAGDVFLAGNFYGKIAFAGTSTLTSIGGDMFAAKITSMGVPVWTTKFGGAYNDCVTSIGTDKNGNVFLTGSFTSPTIVFGSTTLSRKSIQEIFLTQLNGSGQVVWASAYGGVGCSQEASELAVDLAGDVYLTGTYMNQQIYFGSLTFTHAPGPVGSKMFLVKVKNNGTVVWARNAESLAENDMAQAVAVDRFGAVYASGTYYSSWMAFDGDTIFMQSGGWSIYFARIKGNVIDGTVSITNLSNDEKEFSDLKIFPNPSIRFFNILSKGEELEQIKILDAQGKIIFEKNSALPEAVQIDLAEQPAGIYVLLTKSPSAITSRKIVLR